MSRSGFIWLTLLCAATPVVAQQAAPPQKASSVAKLAAQRATTSPKVDGRLDEAVWQNAQWMSDFVQR